VTTPPPSRLARAREVLERVVDPEIPVLTIADLGVLRDVREAPDGALEVVITPTYTGCPAMRMIELEVDAALDRAGLGPRRVATSLSPPWTTDWLSEAGREKLRAYGIAPPPVGGAAAGGRRALFGEDPAPACPRCGSADTERVSEFGSTACKALHRCRACREPFDRFKCV
jgi:ring-1,2-phenylacetyl-CoA epoxidase subunit PaaD